MAPEPGTREGGRRRTAPLDDVDRRIVEALRRDGRASTRSLAAQLHVSRASAYARVDRLERDGVITGYAAVVDPEALGPSLCAYVHLDIAQRSWHVLSEALLGVPEVEHAALVSGEDDIVLFVRTTDASTLRELVLTRLQELPGVRSSRTVLVFEELARRDPRR